MVKKLILFICGWAFILGGHCAFAHGPVFSPGPETVFKGGIELHTEYHAEKAGGDKETEIALEAAYGITENFLVGAELPYAWHKEDGDENAGVGNLSISTKYRFWRKDMLAAQESMAVLGDITLYTADSHSGTTDAKIGLSYGYESLRWQRWASILYDLKGENDENTDKGNTIYANAVLGLRPEPPRYYEPDLMWLLEVNGEITEKSEQGGERLDDTGGTEIFVSPGFFLTYRNAALKGGAQLPVMSDLNGAQQDSDYRFKLAVEFHF